MVEIFVLMAKATTDAQAAAYGGKAAGQYVPVHMTTSLSSAADMAVDLRNRWKTMVKVQSVLADHKGHLSGQGLTAPV